jgi:hypothetical protein
MLGLRPKLRHGGGVTQPEDFDCSLPAWSEKVHEWIELEIFPRHRLKQG